PRRAETAELHAARAGIMRMPSATFPGCVARLWQSFERFRAFRAARMDGARRTENRRSRFSRGFRARIQRGDAPAAMDVTRTLFLILLAGVGLERILELQVSRRHQRDLANCGARKQNDPQYRWMV